MSLDSGGRILLKVFNQHNSLVLSKPCASKKSAEAFYLKMYGDNPTLYRCEMTEMVPRI